MYSIEQLLASFVIGLFVGMLSNNYMDRKGVNIERRVSLAIIIVWGSMHVFAFFFGNHVDWVFNVAGFGALGTFAGINLRSVTSFSDIVNLLKR